MRRAPFVHVDPGRRHARKNGPGGAGVIQVDVRQQNVPHIVEPPPQPRQAVFEGGQARGGARVDNHEAVRGAKGSGRDYAWLPPEAEIDGGAHSVNESGRTCEV